MGFPASSTTVPLIVPVFGVVPKEPREVSKITQLRLTIFIGFPLLWVDSCSSGHFITVRRRNMTQNVNVVRVCVPRQRSVVQGPFHCNFMKIHRTLRTSPAMAAGL